jgi:uncharacterized membrane protein YkvA (DUF1232 family)
MASPEQSRLQRVRRHWVTALKVHARRSLDEFHMIRRALRHPGVPWHAKLVCGLAVLYIVSPIQLIPNFIPILGQMDDLLVLALAIKILKKYASPTALEECRQAPHPSVRLANASQAPAPALWHRNATD